MSDIRNKRSGARVEFHGQGAGLGRVERGGDASDPSNYVLTCGCGVQLGALGGWRADTEGRRCVACPRCNMATVVDKAGQVVKFVPVSAILQAQAQAKGI